MQQLPVRIRRRRLLGTAAVTLALSTVGAGTSQAATDRARRWAFRVVSFNIQHGRGIHDVLDLERLAQTIEAMDADVVGLQEVDRHWSERSEWLDQPTWLANRLRMHVVYGANLDEDPPEPGRPRRQYGNATLSRYPIASWRNTHLPRFAGGEQRGLLEAAIRFRGRTVRVANTHLQHDDNLEREAQAERIIELVGAEATRTFLVGDINAVPGTSAVAILADVFVDTWTKIGRGDGFTIPADEPEARIDYVFGSADVEPTAVQVGATEVSDHRPVIADYRVR